MKTAMAGLAWLLAGVAAPAFPQNLGDAAQKEKKKREAKPAASTVQPKKVFTGDDLAGIAATREPEAAPSAPRASASSGAGPSPIEPAGPRSADEGAVRAAQEKGWRERKSDADRALRDAESRLERAQRNRNMLGTGPTPYQDPGSWGAAANKLDDRLKDAREAQKRAKDAVDKLEEDARRAGVPPGWLR